MEDTGSRKVAIRSDEDPLIRVLHPIVDAELCSTKITCFLPQAPEVKTYHTVGLGRDWTGESVSWQIH